MFPNLESYFTDLLKHKSNETTIVFGIVSFGLLSSDFLLPIPSSIIMYLNGLNLGFVYGLIVSLTSCIVSSFLGYYLGNIFRHKIDKYYTSEQIMLSEKFIYRFGGIGIILSRGIPILSESTSVICGNLNYNFKKFIYLNFIGYIPVCIIYSYLGSISVNKEYFFLAFGINIILASIAWILNKKITAHNV